MSSVYNIESKNDGPSLSELYAKHWCSVLLSPNSTFSRCRSVVDPDTYYKVEWNLSALSFMLRRWSLTLPAVFLQRCVYASCNCEKSESCLCAVFSSYARACASKGVFLTDWRENVCGKDFFHCAVTKLSGGFQGWIIS